MHAGCCCSERKRRHIFDAADQDTQKRHPCSSLLWFCVCSSPCRMNMLKPSSPTGLFHPLKQKPSSPSKTYLIAHAKLLLLKVCPQSQGAHQTCLIFTLILLESRKLGLTPEASFPGALLLNVWTVQLSPVCWTVREAWTHPPLQQTVPGAPG